MILQLNIIYIGQPSPESYNIYHFVCQQTTFWLFLVLLYETHIVLKLIARLYAY